MTTAAWTVIVLLWLVVLALVLVVLALARQIGVLHERLRPVGALQLAQGLKVGAPAPVVEVQSINVKLPDGATAALGMSAGASLAPIKGALASESSTAARTALSPDIGPGVVGSSGLLARATVAAHTGVGGNATSILHEQRFLRIGAPHVDGHDTLVVFVSPSCPVCKSLLPALRAIRRHEQPRVDVILASDGARLEHLDFIAQESLEEFPYVLSEPLGVAYGVGRLPYAVLIDSSGVVRAAGLVNTREQLDSLFEAKERGVANLQELAARGLEPAAVQAASGRHS